MARVAARGVWLNPQSGTRPRRSAGTPAQAPVDPLGDVVRTLEIRVLDVDHAGRDVTTGRDDLGEDLDLGHLAIGELENQLIDVEAEHRLEDGPVCPPRERTTEIVPEAQVRAGADASRDGLDDSVEQGREVRGRVGMDGGRRLVDLDPARTCIGETLELGAQDRHEGRRGLIPVGIDLAGSSGVGRTGCTARGGSPSTVGSSA